MVCYCFTFQLEKEVAQLIRVSFLQHANVAGHWVEPHCRRFSIWVWLAPRCAPNCLQTESKPT